MEIGEGDQAMLAWWNLIKFELPAYEVEMTKMTLFEFYKMITYTMIAIFMKFSKFSVLGFLTILWNISAIATDYVASIKRSKLSTASKWMSLPRALK